MRNVDTNSPEYLRSIVEPHIGHHYTDADVREDLQRGDWSGYYPVVDSEGYLTGEIHNADADDPSYRLSGDYEVVYQDE